MASKINYTNLGDTTPSVMAIMAGIELGEFLEDVLGISDSTKVKILLNGNVTNDMDQELEDGDTVKIEALKTDSGQ